MKAQTLFPNSLGITGEQVRDYEQRQLALEQIEAGIEGLEAFHRSTMRREGNIRGAWDGYIDRTWEDLKKLLEDLGYDVTERESKK